MMLSSPPEKVKRTRTLCQQILAAEGVLLHTLAQLLGVPESHRTTVLNGVMNKWSTQKKMFHINVLELKGVLLAIQALPKNQRQITVSLNMNNSTAVSYINHKGGTHSMELVLLTLELWHWCMMRDICLIAQHVPGKTNTLADRESREFQNETD